MAALATATTAAAAEDDNDDDAAGGSRAAPQGLQAYRLGALAPAEYRAELRAVNTQGDAGARALSARVRVPGGWCGWEAAEGGLTCNESVALIGASSLVVLCLVGLACRRYVLRRRGQGQPLLWHGRAVVDDAEDDEDNAHELSSIGEETSIGVPIGVGGKVRSKATLWQGAGGGGAARGGGPGAEAMRLRLDELRWRPSLDLRCPILTMPILLTKPTLTLARPTSAPYPLRLHLLTTTPHYGHVVPWLHAPWLY